MIKDHDTIAKKAIWRAIERGYDHCIPPRTRNLIVDVRGDRIWIGEDGGLGKGYVLNYLLTSQSFAKAFFETDWQTHLTNMLYAKDPVEYVGRYL